MENVGIFYDRLEYFVFILYSFGMFGPRKIWQPCKAYTHKAKKRVQ
jgi:hypothetical protein